MASESDVSAAIGGERHDKDAYAGEVVMTGSDIGEALDRYFTSDDADDERHKPRVGVYHASNTSRCLRQRFYKDTEVATDDVFPPGIAERGNNIEDSVYRALSQELSSVFGVETEVRGVEVDNDLRVVYDGDGWHITGSTDPYIMIGGDVASICEVKSTQKDIWSDEFPKIEHQMQLNIYLSVMGLSHGFIVYMNSHNYEYRIITFQQDPQLWEVEKFLNDTYHDFRVADKLPPKTPIKDNECKYCSYQPLCVRDDDGRKYRPGQPYHF